MNTLRDAAQQALEALTPFVRGIWTPGLAAQAAAAMERLEAALAEPVQEPVGVVTSMVKGGVTWHRWPSDMPDGTTLYAAPPQRKPLTEEELDELAMDEDGLPNSHLEFARAIERAHGIGGQP